MAERKSSPPSASLNLTQFRPPTFPTPSQTEHPKPQSDYHQSNTDTHRIPRVNFPPTMSSVNSLLRTARLLRFPFPWKVSTPSSITCIQQRSLSTSTFYTALSALRRPVSVAKSENIVGEQVRGMKTRSSVKKLCEGCKVCEFSQQSFIRYSERSELWLTQALGI